MAVTDFADFITKRNSPMYSVDRFYKPTMDTTYPRGWWSGWRQTAPSAYSGAAPTTAAVPITTTQGCFDHEKLGQALSGTLYIGRIVTSMGADPGFTEYRAIDYGFVMLCDRLSHQGGLSGTSVATQTTNLPTAALTRYTSGEGVFAVIEGSMGTSSTPKFTVSYTNQAGTAGQSGYAISDHLNSQGSRHKTWPVLLAAGDTGIRSVESVTLDVSSGAVGTWGVTLYKPLCIVPFHTEAVYDWNPVIGGAGVIPQLVANYCLVPIFFSRRWNINNRVWEYRELCLHVELFEA